MRSPVPRLLPLAILGLLLPIPAAAHGRTQDDPFPAALPSTDPATPVQPAAPEPAAKAFAAAIDEDEHARETAETPTPFGEAGQWILSSDFQVSAASVSYSATEASSYSYGAAPSVDVFVVKGVSVGAYASASRSGGSGYSASSSELRSSATTSFSAGVRIGVNIPITRALSVWPRVNLAWGMSKTVLDVGSLGIFRGGESSDETGHVGVYAPLLLNVAPHAFVGLGPSLWRTFGHTETGYAHAIGNRTSIGAAFTVGGYL